MRYKSGLNRVTRYEYYQPIDYRFIAVSSLFGSIVVIVLAFALF